MGTGLGEYVFKIFGKKRDSITVGEHKGVYYLCGGYYYNVGQYYCCGSIKKSTITQCGA